MAPRRAVRHVETGGTPGGGGSVAAALGGGRVQATTTTAAGWDATPCQRLLLYSRRHCCWRSTRPGARAAAAAAACWGAGGACAPASGTWQSSRGGAADACRWGEGTHCGQPSLTGKRPRPPPVGPIERTRPGRGAGGVGDGGGDPPPITPLGRTPPQPRPWPYVVRVCLVRRGTRGRLARSGWGEGRAAEGAACAGVAPAATPHLRLCRGGGGEGVGRDAAPAGKGGQPAGPLSSSSLRPRLALPETAGRGGGCWGGAEEEGSGRVVGCKEKNTGVWGGQGDGRADPSPSGERTTAVWGGREGKGEQTDATEGGRDRDKRIRAG